MYHYLQTWLHLSPHCCRVGVGLTHFITLCIITWCKYFNMMLDKIIIIIIIKIICIQSFPNSNHFKTIGRTKGTYLWHLFVSLRGLALFSAPLLWMLTSSEPGDYLEIYSEKNECSGRNQPAYQWQLMHWISSLEHNWFGSIFSLPGCY